MFLHGGWDDILGNMLFLAIFGKNVEDAYGPLRYLLFYFARGFAAIMTQTAMTLLFGSAADGRVPTLGASGAIAAVLGALFFLLYPGSRVLTWIFPIFLVHIPASVFLGLWFLYQLIEANFGLFSASANGGGVPPWPTSAGSSSACACCDLAAGQRRAGRAAGAVAFSAAGLSGVLGPAGRNEAVTFVPTPGTDEDHSMGTSGETEVPVTVAVPSSRESAAVPSPVRAVDAAV